MITFAVEHDSATYYTVALLCLNKLQRIFSVLYYTIPCYVILYNKAAAQGRAIQQHVDQYCIMQPATISILGCGLLASCRVFCAAHSSGSALHRAYAYVPGDSSWVFSLELLTSHWH